MTLRHSKVHASQHEATQLCVAYGFQLARIVKQDFGLLVAFLSVPWPWPAYIYLSAMLGSNFTHFSQGHAYVILLLEAQSSRLGRALTKTIKHPEMATLAQFAQ